MLELKYGDPPRIEDCEEFKLGVNAPSRIDNEGEFAGQMPLFDMYGMKMPKWARARYVVARVRHAKLPAKVQVAGLGTVLVGEKGWEVV